MEKKLDPELTPALLEIKKRYRRMMIGIIASALALIIAIPAGTLAWMSSIREVEASGKTSSVESEGSLFIADGDVRGNLPDEPGVSVTGSFSGELYPISTYDMTAWWQVADWQGLNAKGYIQVSPSQSDDVDRYEYTLGGTKLTAYNTANYTLYCNQGASMDVYFRDAGITVTHDGTADTNPKHLIDALRVGIKVGGNLLIYAPVAESGRGNSLNAEAGKYYAVTGTDSIVENNNVVSSLTAYTAGFDETTEKYTAGTTPICKATDTGVLLQVYVWLEGTDADAMISKSDGASGIDVKLTLAGVEVK